jgi:lipopolysaccharide/colanic/teichoic acid biosynthesis glycosyltransferase
MDELPQLWNVLKGEMSFVGPRPCLPIQRELIDERQKRGVFDLRPGITGLAQVQGIDMSDPRRLAEVDATYMKKQNLMFDFLLIVRTVTGSGRGDRVRS